MADANSCIGDAAPCGEFYAGCAIGCLMGAAIIYTSRMLNTY